MTLTKLLPLLLVFPVLTAHASSDLQTDCRMRGLYTNDAFGFSVIIPLDHVACPNSPLGMREHGLVVELSEDWKRNIEAYGGYNSNEFADLGDTAEGSRDLLADGLPENSVTELSRSAARLGELPAIRIVMRVRSGENQEPMIQDEISALRQLNPETPLPSHLYALRLTTQASHYAEDRKIFEKMLRTWRVLPADNDFPEPNQSR